MTMASPSAPDTTGADGSSSRISKVVVTGNPNAGKTTIFNRLTGLSQKVGNYPGVTVDRKEGRLRGVDRKVVLVDLPGTYSLAAYSPDEVAAIDVLLGQHAGGALPDLIVHVVDASNLERNLYLFSQLRELGRPMILALNMIDVARRRGLEIDASRLQRQLGVHVVVTHGQKGDGIAELRNSVVEHCTRSSSPGTPTTPLPASLTEAVNTFRDSLDDGERRRLGHELHFCEALRAVVDVNGHCERRVTAKLGDAIRTRIESARAKANSGLPLAMLETRTRYRWIDEHIEGCCEQKTREKIHLSERLDSVLTHHTWGFLIFAAVMLLLFQSIFTWAGPLMDLVDSAFSALGGWVGANLPEGVLRSLIVDGIVGGVGGVVIFLPQILILFLFIGLLEDCGYMARAAFLMDRVMSRCGLSGKSFIPMLSGFACAIPGVMAARVIEDRRDRLATILVTPLMTCSARLPVYAILIGTFIPDESILAGIVGLRAATLFGLYVLGIVTAVAMAWLFGKTLLRGKSTPFLLEMPSYKLPSLGTVLLRLLDRGKAFLTRAGTIILAISVIVWALAYFPRSSETVAEFTARRAPLEAALEATPPDDVDARARIATDIATIDQEQAGEHLRQSLFGRMGRTVEPAFEPLGWDWRISMAAIASFPAREVVVSTLGTIYNLSNEEDEESETLRERLRDARRDGTAERVFTVPVALSIMVFFALCCQCGATLAMIKRETRSWGWAGLTFGYMTALAYAAALVVYQVAIRFTG